METFRALSAVLLAIPRPENDAFNDRHRRYRDDPLTRAMQFSRNGDPYPPQVPDFPRRSMRTTSFQALLFSTIIRFFFFFFLDNEISRFPEF